MTVVDDDGPDTALSADDPFGLSKLQRLSRFQTQTDPIFKVGFILAGAHLQCVLSSIKFTVRATDRLARAQVRLLGQGKPSAQDFPQHVRTVVDEARSSLGDIAEMASHEFRQLQLQLHELQEGTRGLVPETSIFEGAYKRRWKAKS